MVTASKHQLHPFMKEISKILACCGEYLKLFLSPFPRYLLRSCCTDPGHVTNLQEDDHISILLDHSRDLARTIRELCFTCGIKRFKVLNPVPMIAGDEDIAAKLDRESLAMIWGDDPVHPSTTAYDNLAECLVRTCSDLEDKAPSSSHKSGPPPAKRPAIHRASWIHSDESGIAYVPRGNRGQWPRYRGGKRPFRGCGGRGGGRGMPSY